MFMMYDIPCSDNRTQSRYFQAIELEELVLNIENFLVYFLVGGQITDISPVTTLPIGSEKWIDHCITGFQEIRKNVVSIIWFHSRRKWDNCWAWNRLSCLKNQNEPAALDNRRSRGQVFRPALLQELKISFLSSIFPFVFFVMRLIFYLIKFPVHWYALAPAGQF